MLESGERGVGTVRDNPLVRVVGLIGPEGRRAMYDAATTDTMRRGTWRGCAFNRAGRVLGLSVTSGRRAARAFDMSPGDVRRFVTEWDRLKGTDEECTALLRDALLTVGFAEPLDGAEDVDGPDDVDLDVLRSELVPA